MVKSSVNGYWRRVRRRLFVVNEWLATVLDVAVNLHMPVVVTRSRRIFGFGFWNFEFSGVV